MAAGVANPVTPPAWLIVGLGNPGPEYAWTPHNLGFLAIDRLAEAMGTRVERPEAKSFLGFGTLAGKRVALAKPQTYMNASGMAVRELVHRLEVPPARLIVLLDDVALPWGMLRIRPRGSAGGHNGLASIIGALGTEQFIRVRMGIQPDHPVADLAAYVLRPMRQAELERAAEMTAAAAEAVRLIVAEGVGRAMARFNRRASPPENQAADEPAC
jgi:PTH1 family peptidyl-tRNA hydrolase